MPRVVSAKRKSMGERAGEERQGDKEGKVETYGMAGERGREREEREGEYETLMRSAAEP
jgi:hypothetical protein